MDWNNIVSGKSACGGSEFDNKKSPDKGVIKVVVEHRTRTVVQETYIVHTYVDGDLRTIENMPGCASSGRRFADDEVRKTAELAKRNGYKFVTETVDTK